eukprot:CAMPEP_0171140002 /NCGR_PEP_ID=MMETSP0766_2-20121228/137890_1 /TAXON_ID=439317 /ORGANISM="Gambierdiscus australes, Strain CAWD 149" /LENGTH=111 /DNA_ID=CAMNT_0011603683 /DNA_START=41 /DNA_END=372 /DNA_ORIENTATION=+
MSVGAYSVNETAALPEQLAMPSFKSSSVAKRKGAPSRARKEAERLSQPEWEMDRLSVLEDRLNVVELRKEKLTSQEGEEKDKPGETAQEAKRDEEIDEMFADLETAVKYLG